MIDQWNSSDKHMDFMDLIICKDITSYARQTRIFDSINNENVSNNNWLVGGLEHFLLFRNIWDNPSHWHPLTNIFSEGLKPPTSKHINERRIFRAMEYSIIRDAETQVFFTRFEDMFTLLTYLKWYIDWMHMISEWVSVHLWNHLKSEWIAYLNFHELSAGEALDVSRLL